ncbi:MAG: hypothetical protein RLY93_17900 [Sumerlaeia bacterium]
MPTEAALIYGMARQMYEDIRYVAGNNPKEVVDDDTAKMFNNLLKNVRAVFPTLRQINDFDPMAPRTLKYKDAMVVVGQLASLLKIINDEHNRLSDAAAGRARAPQQGQGAAKAPAQGGNRGPGAKAAPQEEPLFHDRELYGDSPPKTLTDEGIVPFTLDD